MKKLLSVLLTAAALFTAAIFISNGMFLYGNRESSEALLAEKKMAENETVRETEMLVESETLMETETFVEPEVLMETEHLIETEELSEQETEYRFTANGEVIYYSSVSGKHIAVDKKTAVMYVDNELIVQFSTPVSEEEACRFAEKYRAKQVGFISISGTCQWRFEESVTKDELRKLADEINGQDKIKGVHINYISQIQEDKMPTKESAKWEKKDNNWGYKDIHAEAAQNLKLYMYDPINIGILDGGFQKHPDVELTILKNSTDYLTDEEKEEFLKGWSHAKEWTEIEENSAHGTHVTGIAAATCDNGIGIAGVYPNPEGQGEIYGYSWIPANGKAVSEMEYMGQFANLMVEQVNTLTDKGVKVINVSLGGKTELVYSVYKERQSSKSIGALERENLYEEAIAWEEYLGNIIDAGYEFLIINSAGNDSAHETGVGDNYFYKKNEDINDDNPYPYIVSEEGETAVIDPEINYFLTYIKEERIKERIICVGAYGKDRKIASFSNMGDRVDIMAPGVEIYSTDSSDDKKYSVKSGTSMSAPYVTGAAACIWSLDQTLTAKEVRSILMQEINGGEASAWITDQEINCSKPVLDVRESLELGIDYVQWNVSSVIQYVENTTYICGDSDGGCPIEDVQENTIVLEDTCSAIVKKNERILLKKNGNENLGVLEYWKINNDKKECRVIAENVVIGSPFVQRKRDVYYFGTDGCMWKVNIDEDEKECIFKAIDYGISAEVYELGMWRTYGCPFDGNLYFTSSPSRGYIYKMDFAGKIEQICYDKSGGSLIDGFAADGQYVYIGSVDGTISDYRLNEEADEGGTIFSFASPSFALRGRDMYLAINGDLSHVDAYDSTEVVLAKKDCNSVMYADGNRVFFRRNQLDGEKYIGYRYYSCDVHGLDEKYHGYRPFKAVSQEEYQTVKIKNNKESDGKLLYAEVLNSYVKMFEQQWSMEQISENNFCYLFGWDMAAENNGYYFEDLDGDGTVELLVGHLDNGQNDYLGMIYDLYTIVDDQVILVATSGERDRYGLCEDSIVGNDASGGAMVSEKTYYRLNGGCLEFVEKVGYDGTWNAQDPLFYSDKGESEENYMPVMQEAYDAVINAHPYVPISYIPFSELQEEHTGENTGERLLDFLRNTLVPQYGIMDTQELYTQNVNASGGVQDWGEQELTGMLSASVRDFDGDGQEEMLVVCCETHEDSENVMDERKFTYVKMQMYEYDMKTDEIYMSAERTFPSCNSFINGMGYGQIGLFAYEYGGNLYIAADNFLRVNECIVTVDVYLYDGTQFVFTDGLGYQAQGEGDVCVWEAVKEPEAASRTNCADWADVLEGTEERTWEELMSFRVADYDYHRQLTKEEEQQFYNLYSSKLRELGLQVNDLRLWVNQEEVSPGVNEVEYQSWYNKYAEITAPEVYDAIEGQIQFISGISTHQIMGGPFCLYRRDYEGMLDVYRGQNAGIAQEMESGKVEEKKHAEDGQIIPDSNSRYLTEADLVNLSAQQICYAKNEIYARHGRKFLSGELTNYFNAQTWYTGTIEAANFTEETVNALFNEYEKENVRFIVDWESKYGAYNPS